VSKKFKGTCFQLTTVAGVLFFLLLKSENPKLKNLIYQLQRKKGNWKILSKNGQGKRRNDYKKVILEKKNGGVHRF